MVVVEELKSEGAFFWRPHATGTMLADVLDLPLSLKKTTLRECPHKAHGRHAAVHVFLPSVGREV